MSSESYDTVLAPGRSMSGYWRELWAFRELLYYLAWRDITVRYKQAAIGVAWSAIRPLLTMIIFTIIFNRIARLPSAHVPYPLLVLTGLLPWTLFATAVGESANSLVENQSMVSKIYFPRIMIPVSSVAVALVDFLVALVLLVPFMAWFRVLPDWHVVFLPGFLVLAVLSSIGPGLWLGALNVKYRDFRYVVPFILQLGLYISPVGFSSGLTREWRLLYALNPMVGVIDGFRWSILGSSQQLYAPGLVLSTGTAIILLVSGVRYFRSTERTFADVI